MEKIVYKLSKTNLLAACGLACVVGFISNTIFNGVGSIAFNSDSVNVANNVVDSIQLSLYVAAKLVTTGRLNRYDLPAILGGITSLIF